MKKTKLIGLVTLLLSLGVVGCGGGDDAPTYESDKTYHWTLTEDGEVDKETKAKHDFEEVPEMAVTATCTVEGKKVEKCKVCGYLKETKINTVNHTYVVVEAESTAATCGAPGVKVEKCSVCNDVKRTDLPALAHDFEAKTDATHTNPASGSCAHWEKCKNCTTWRRVVAPASEHSWGEYGAEVTATGTTTYKVRTCANCGAVDICFSALDYTKISGSNKDTTKATIKLSANGDNVDYTINLTKAFSGTIAVYGWVDRFAGSDNNGTKGFFTGKNDASKGNIAIKANNGPAIEITNTKTYTENGMEASGVKVGDNGVESSNGYERSTPALCELGLISLNSGSNTINYARVDSYNLNITEIHLIGFLAD